MYYRHSISRLIFTSGVLDLAERNGAFWLIDAVASYQPQLRNDDDAFQLWNLEVADSKAVLTARRDTHEPALVTQEVPFTDYPEPGARLYCIVDHEGVPHLMLPEEY